MRLLTTLLAVLWMTSESRAQSPQDFFPAQVGDLWEYQGDFGWYRNAITRDSVDADSNVYLFYNDQSLPSYRIDTLLCVTRFVFSVEFLYYRLNADSGEIWVYDPRPSGLFAWIADIETTFVFGQPSVIKIIRYGPDSTNLGWYYIERYLASSFGLIYEWWEPGEMTYLSGCIIDGDTFGTITDVTPSPTSSSPSNIQILSAYPNPFNQISHLAVHLSYGTRFTLRVYDMLGREVRKIYDGYRPAGRHRFTFNGHKLASGVYIIRLQAGGVSRSRKVLLVK